MYRRIAFIANCVPIALILFFAYYLPFAPVFLIDDDALPTAAVAPAKPDRRRRSSQLQDITEEEEEISSGSGSSEQPLLPPLNLELDRQFVEGDGYGVALTWTPPSPFPPHAIGYNVYVNGELMSVVEGVEKSSVIISGVPRKQVSCIESLLHGVARQINTRGDINFSEAKNWGGRQKDIMLLCFV